MQITADNLDKTLNNAGWLILARVTDTGQVHVGKLRKGEVISYEDLVSYGSADTVVDSLIPNGQWDAAVIQYFPHTKRYTVKRGEIL